MRRSFAVVLVSVCTFVARPVAAQRQATTIAPNDNLIADGIPAIPASLVEATRRYTEVRSAGLVDWHPQAHEVLIRTRFGNTAQFHRVRMPGGDRTQLTFFEDPVGGAVYEPRAGKYFLFTKDVGGGEFFPIYRFDLATGDAVLLTDGQSQNGGIR
ncbi:MAG: S9 family peptidase, partial [Acidimicrobiales bacterium]